MPLSSTTTRIMLPPPEPSRRAFRQHHRWLKHLQLVLGPKLATRKHLLLFVACLQAVAVVLLCTALVARHHVLQQLRASPAASSWTPQHGSGQHLLTHEPNERFVARVEQRASGGPFKALFLGPTRRFAAFGRSAACVPQACTLDHWAALGERACFLRNDRAKDRRGHNATVWRLVQSEWYYSEANDFACPAVVCRKQWLRELNLTKTLAYSVLDEHFKNETNSTLVSLVLGNSFVRLNPFWGLEYRLNGVLTLETPRGADTLRESPRRASITLRRGFTQKFCDVALHDSVLAEEQPVYVIVPYSGRVGMLRKFLVNAKSLLDDGVAMRVVLSVFGGEMHVQAAHLILNELGIGTMVGNLSDGNVIQIVESRGDFRGNFSRSQALYEGSTHAPAEGLLFFCDVDVEIHKQFFDNCKYNTEKAHQVYYPVLYSLYPYGTEISKEHGYWRNGAYGMVCVFNSDFRSRKVWGTESRRKAFSGWGMEGVALYKEFANVWQYTVFRAVEPNLLHRWHAQVCDFNGNIAACLDTVLQNLGTQAFLASVIAGRGIDVRKEPYFPEPIDFEEYKNDSAGSQRRKFEIPVPESVSDTSKLKQLESFYQTGIRKSNRDRLLRYLSEKALQIFDRATG
ncbi:unnamed protein product [Agarophyton chilense]